MVPVLTQPGVHLAVGGVPFKIKYFQSFVKSFIKNSKCSLASILYYEYPDNIPAGLFLRKVAREYQNAHVI